MDHNRDTHARSHAQMSLSQARTPDAPRQVWGKGQPQPCADIWTWAWVWAVSKLVVALQPSEQSHTYGVRCSPLYPAPLQGGPARASLGRSLLTGEIPRF